MNEEEREQQQRLHGAIEDVLRESGDLPDGHFLAGWVVCFETASLNESKSCAGHFYGPREMTTWRAVGLVEWARDTMRASVDEDD